MTHHGKSTVQKKNIRDHKKKEGKEWKREKQMYERAEKESRERKRPKGEPGIKAEEVEEKGKVMEEK